MFCFVIFSNAEFVNEVSFHCAFLLSSGTLTKRRLTVSSNLDWLVTAVGCISLTLLILRCSNFS